MDVERAAPESAKGAASLLLGDVLPFLGSVARENASRLALSVSESELEEVMFDVADRVLEQYANVPLAELLPVLNTRADEPVPVHELDTRSSNTLVRLGLHETWGALLAHSLGELAEIRNLGVLSLRRILVFCARHAVSTLSRGGTRIDRGAGVVFVDHQRRSAVEHFLSRLAAWARVEHDAGTLGDVLVHLHAPEQLPAALGKAWAELSSLHVEELTERDTETVAWDEAVRRLLAPFDERARAVVDERIFNPGRRATLDELGKRFGVTRERIRQLESRAEEQLRDALDAPEFEELTWMARRVRRELGTVARATTVSSMLRSVIGRDVNVPRSEQNVLLWLAGPYRLEGPWLVASLDIRARTEEVLRRETDARFAALETVVAALNELDIHGEVAQAWLRDQKGWRIDDGVVVPWQGSLVEKAETVLLLAGEPLSRDEINARIKEGHGLGSLRNALASSEQIVRLDRDKWGLRAWGGQAYTNIADAIEDEIERRGGEATLADVVVTITDRFSVRASSVVAYASSHRFSQPRRGWVALGRGRRPPTTRSASPLELTRRCFSTDSGWTIRFDVDTDLLRGSGRLLSNALGWHLGLSPGGATRFHSPYGDVNFSWSAPQPAVGSLRPLAQALRLDVGDILFVDVNGNAVVPRGVGQQDLNGVRGWQRVALEVGRGLIQDHAVAKRAVASAIGLRPDADADEIRARFTARRERDIALLVPD